MLLLLLLLQVSFAFLYPWTGRKHQLRVHCASVLKAPILGDDKYGPDVADKFQVSPNLAPLFCFTRLMGNNMVARSGEGEKLALALPFYGDTPSNERKKEIEDCGSTSKLLHKNVGVF